MNDTQKVLQMIINRQASFRQELLKKINQLDKKLSDRIDQVENGLFESINIAEKRTKKRLIKLKEKLDL
jgi:hypothetical protein